MRYYYEKPKAWSVSKGITYVCDHPLYDKCTLYLQDDKGVAIVQKRFSHKSIWLGPIDPWLVDDIYNQPTWPDWFDKNSGDCKDGLYPSFELRKVMWALRMKPLPMQYWERSRHVQGL